MTLFQRSETVRDFNGVVVSKASVKVVVGLTYDDAAPLAVLYSDPAGLVPLDNPLQADAAGRYSYWVDVADYFSEQISRSGYVSYTEEGFFLGALEGPPGPQGAAGPPGPDISPQLANTANPAYGGGMVGHNPNLTYPANTVGSRLNQKADLALLAETLDPSTGAGMIGFTDGVGYDPGTIGDALEAAIDESALIRSDLAATTGATLLGWLSPLTGAIIRTASQIFGELPVSPHWFGAVGDGVTDDTAAIQAALDAMTSGGVLKFGPKSYAYTQMVVSNPYTTIKLDPATNLINNNASSAAAAGPTVYNQAYCSIVLNAANCVIDGSKTGRITSPATWDGTNSYIGYSNIVALADGCEVINLHMVNIRRCGIWGKDVDDFEVSGCTLEGNYPSASWTGVETANYGILYDVGVGSIKGIFKSTGNTLRSTVQGIFAGNYGSGSVTTQGGTLVASNNFEGIWNHGIYSPSGQGSVVSGNNFLRCKLPVVLYGHAHSVTGNTIWTDSTGLQTDMVGIQIRNAMDCVVSGNTLYGDAQAGSTIIDLTNTDGTGVPAYTIKGNIVSDNVIYCPVGAATAINVGSVSLTRFCYSNKILNNTITGLGRTNIGLIALAGNAAYPSGNYYNEVRGNTITCIGTTGGVYASYQMLSRIVDNTIVWQADYAGIVGGIHCASTVTKSEIARNTIITTADFGTGTTIRPIWTNTACDFNLVQNNILSIDTTKVTLVTPLFLTGSNNVVRDNVAAGFSAKLSGTATILSGQASIVVANTNVTTDSIVLIAPSTANAAAAMASPGVYVTQTAGTGFSIVMQTGTAAADSAFRWVIR